MFPSRSPRFPRHNSRCSSSVWAAHDLSRATATAISPTSGSAHRRTSPIQANGNCAPSVAEHEADSMEAQTDSVRRTVVGNLKMVYFRLAYIQQTLGVLQRSDELLNQVQEASEARYRVGQGNQQDVLKAQLQHTKILQEIAHHHQEEGLLEAQIKQVLGRPQESADIVAETLTVRASSVFRSRTLAASS